MPKRFVLYPGVGRVRPSDPRETYIAGKVLAACYSVPYSDCLDMDNPAIQRVARLGAKFDELIPLLPSMGGRYSVPNRNDKKIILADGLHEKVSKNG